VIHLRILVPKDLAERVLDLLCAAPAVSSVVHLAGAARKPDGDVILCDVAREDGSVILSALKELNVHHRGSIAVEDVDSAISDVAVAAEKAASGLPSDAVVWEEVEARTSENTELGGGFLALMTLATIIASIGILTDSPILIIGAMVVGPEFGPLAGFCVAVVHKRRDLAIRSFTALAVGFPVAMTITLLTTLFFNWVDIAPSTLDISRPLTDFISHPNWFSVVVALCAGVAGILSLTNAKSGALVGVLISVTTIPSAANVAVAVAYADWDEWIGAMLQLSVNLLMIVAAGIATLFIQRRLYIQRRRKHLMAHYREAGGLPLGHSRSGSVILPSFRSEQEAELDRRPE
jgi:uncharacterized hydrophobic protein (TIGR00271 family)